MKVIEIDVKQGKRKRKLIVALVDDDDVKQLDKSMLQGEFDRGLFFVASSEREEEVMEILSRMKDDA